MARFKKGCIPWTKGRKLSDEHRMKLSLASKGRIFSLEHLKKMSESHKGKPAWNKGLRYAQKKIYVCFNCGEDIGYISSYRIKKNPNRICMACYKSTRKGKTKHMAGYIVVTTIPGRKGKRELEHRLVMEKVLGRELSSKEVVHHKNGNRADNNPENLVLCQSAGTHIRDYHRNPNFTHRKPKIKASELWG